MAEQEVNPNSLAYLIGTINQRLESGEKIMTSLTVATEKLSLAINLLPCESREQRIKALEKERTRRIGVSDAIKVALLSTFISVAGTLLIIVVTGGNL